MNPNLIKRGKLIIAGVTGDGNQTSEVWQAFEKLCRNSSLTNKLSDHGYEIRIYGENHCTVHVGYLVSDANVDSNYAVMTLPASRYASFDVYVAHGYESENNAMDEWLHTNESGYKQRYLDQKPYVVEYYDERFNGSEAGSIVEIWIPIENKR